jgi:membrane-associated phospholipid phosphatase
MTAQKASSSAKRLWFARLVSAVVHPLVVPLLTLGLLVYLTLGGSFTQRDTAALLRALELMAVAVVVTAAPIGALVFIQVARGAWTDLDVSIRESRYILYPFGIACILLSVGVFSLLGAPLIAIQGAVGLVTANVVNFLINLRYKVSTHAAAAALSATLLWLAAPSSDYPFVVGGIATVAALLVGWSRVALGRHTTGQVILGWLVGMASGIAVIAFF